MSNRYSLPHALPLLLQKLKLPTSPHPPRATLFDYHIPVIINLSALCWPSVHFISTMDVSLLWGCIGFYMLALYPALWGN